MNGKWTMTLAAACALVGLIPLFGEETEATLKQALTDGEVQLSFRYRIETVDDDASTKDATAGTLRTALGYKSKAYKGWTLGLAAENVAVLGSDDYRNAGAGHLDNGVRDRPVIADPAVTSVQEATLSYTDDDFNAKLGRQEIKWADQRFVGAVGWRQHHQTFDALRVGYQATDNIELTYAYLGKAHRIVGATVDMSSHLAEAKFALGTPGSSVSPTVRGYVLALDYDHLAGLSTTTFGAEFAGKQPWGDSRSWLYEAEYANQSDSGDNPADISADYLHLMAGAALNPVTVKVGLEVLSGGPDGAFRTPLGTLHKFNGWADKFLATPANGLKDVYLSVASTHGPWGWSGIYHDFSADNGSASYGSELDAVVSYKTQWGQTFALKTASYEAEAHSTDTTKWWLWTQISF